LTVSPLTVPFDVIVVDPDLLWRVDAMNAFGHVMTKDVITVLGACDELMPGHPAIVVLGPAASLESDDQLPALRSGFPEVRVVALVDLPSSADRMAFDRVLPADTPVENVVTVGLEELALARTAASSDAAGARATRPRLVVVTAAKAGEGATTVAVNLAAAAARTGSRVVLVEADPVFGDAAMMLGLSIEAEGMSTHGPTGMRFLVAPTPPQPFDPVDDRELADAIGAITAGDSPRQSADVVVVDAPAHLVHRTGLAGLADDVYIVCTERLSAVKNARVLIDALPPVAVGVVLNRVGRSGLPAETLEHLLGAAIAAQLPETDDLVPERFDTVVGLLPERSAYVRALDPVAARVAARPT
jgi:Mrp family chromosome partitioning ATPase